MNTQIASTVYMNLSVPDRVRLVEDIWDSIEAESPVSIGLSQAQIAELHRRDAAHHADPSSAIPWEQVRSKLFADKP